MKLPKRVGEMRKRTNERKNRKAETQGFRECGEIGAGEGERGNLCDGGEPAGNGCGKGIARDFQGNGKRGFWEMRKKKKN